jgi:hypothetical protein
MGSNHRALQIETSPRRRVMLAPLITVSLCGVVIVLGIAAGGRMAEIPPGIWCFVWVRISASPRTELKHSGRVLFWAA